MSQKTIHFIEYNAGSHVPFGETLLSSILFGLGLGMNVIQFFMGNPQEYNRTVINDTDIERCKKILQRFPISIFTHFPYSANFAGSSKDGLAWTGNSKIDWLMRKKIKGLEYELMITSSLGMEKNGVIIHPGSFPDREKGHETVGKSMNRVNFSEGSMVLLENCAGEGNKLCKTFVEIKNVLDVIDDKRKDNVGVCIDTAHIWGAGTYDLSKVEGVEKMFNEFNDVIGIEKFKLLHLNDSKAKFASKRDLHQLIGQGEIWGKSMDSLRVLIGKCKQYNIPIVLETSPLDVFVISEI